MAGAGLCRALGGILIAFRGRELRVGPWLYDKGADVSSRP